MDELEQARNGSRLTSDDDVDHEIGHDHDHDDDDVDDNTLSDKILIQNSVELIKVVTSLIM